MANRSSFYWALRAAFALSRHVPLAWRYRLGGLGGEIAYWCWPAKRASTQRTMAIVTGDAADGPRARAMARASWRNYGRFIVDFLNLPNVPPAEIVRRTDIQGWEHFDRAIAAGKGGLICTGHIGLWDYAPAALSARYPGGLYLIAEPFSSPGVDQLIQGQRAAQGATVIPMAGVRKMVRALHSNGVICVLVDRPVHEDGVVVRFFGRETMVPGGAATLAAMTGAALLPGYFVHGPNGDYKGYFLPPVEVANTGDRAADVQRMTQGIFTALERMIARDPTHWYMFRDMWATENALAREVSDVGAPV